MSDRIIAFLTASGIPMEYIPQMGCYLASAEEVSAASGVPLEVLGDTPAIAIPYPGVAAPDGSPYRRYRRSSGKPKYLGLQGVPPAVYFPPGYEKVAQQPILFVCEGEKKAAALVSRDIRAIAISGTYSWAEPGPRLAQKLQGEPASADTVPLKVLVEEALRAKQVIVIGDSDLWTNPQARHGFVTLVMALRKSLQLRLQIRSQQPNWKPIEHARTAMVSLAILYPRFVQDESRKGLADEWSAEKVGIDDYLVRLLVESECNSTTEAEIRYQLLQQLQALALSDLGCDDHTLAVQVSAANQESLSHRNKHWMVYQPGAGIWVESHDNAEHQAPVREADQYKQAASVLRTMISEAIQLFAGKEKKTFHSV